MSTSTISLSVAPVREVRRDLKRNVRWVLGFLGAVIVWVLISSLIIQALEDGTSNPVDKSPISWSFGKACYFTVINMATVGFGDVVPITPGGRFLACVNAVLGLLFFGLLVAVFALSLQPASWSGRISVPAAPAPRDTPGVAPPDADAAALMHFLDAVADVMEGRDHGEADQVVDGSTIHMHLHRLGRRDVIIEIHVAHGG
jgi:hypothetical protein